MRCTKCGYDGTGNIPGGTCIKCGTRLTASGPAPVSGVNRSFPDDDSQSRPTMIGMKVPEEQNLRATRIVGAAEPQSPLKQTVIQNMVPGRGEQIKSTVIQGANNAPEPSPLPFDESGELTCPQCGYPLADHYTGCPNCGADFTGESEEVPVEVKSEQTKKDDLTSTKKGCKKTKRDDSSPIQGTVGLSTLKKEESESEEDFLCTCEKCGEEISATFRFCPKCGTEVRQKTLHGFRHKKRMDEAEESPQPAKIMKFNLTIVPEDDEDIKPVASCFEGAEVLLNRKNTEPDNRTITSKEQAMVIYEQGKWYIENRSEYNSTLILANRKMEIQSGDIIMLGDRRFKFEEEESEQK